MKAIELQQIPAEPGQHATGDKRRPTRYAVLVNGRKVGEVFSRSRASWRVHSRRVRAGFQGYTRGWQAVDANGRIVPGDMGHRMMLSSRARALEELLEPWSQAWMDVRGAQLGLRPEPHRRGITARQIQEALRGTADEIPEWEVPLR